jgi:hypothetical protein
VRRVVSETSKIGIETGLGEDLGVMGSDHASSLSLKRASHHGSATALPAARNDFVDELDEVIGQPYCDLLAHTIMVPEWDHAGQDDELLIVDPDEQRAHWLGLEQGRYLPVERSAPIDLSAAELSQRIDWPR